MIALVCSIWSVLAAPFSKLRLEVENAALRRQLVVLQRKLRGRIEFMNGDRRYFIMLYRLFPSVLKTMVIVRPETVVRWHRAGFRRYWRWKSRGRGRRPAIAEIARVNPKMSIENLLWGAPRIRGNSQASCRGSIDRRQIHGQER